MDDMMEVARKMGSEWQYKAESWLRMGWEVTLVSDVSPLISQKKHLTVGQWQEADVAALLQGHICPWWFPVELCSAW